MENLEIRIIITDGEKEAKTSVNVADYQKIKESHGVNVVDMQIDMLLDEIKTNNSSN